ncbi:hypothetical protein AAY473_036071 [Plecturocebus cupreus]
MCKIVKLLRRLRQQNLDPGGGSCSELRSHHCTPAWATRAKLHPKKKERKLEENFFAKEGDQKENAAFQNVYYSPVMGTEDSEEREDPVRFKRTDMAQECQSRTAVASEYLSSFTILSFLLRSRKRQEASALILAVWEAEEGGLPKEFKTSLANKLLRRLRQENPLNLEGGVCKEPRSCHCTLQPGLECSDTIMAYYKLNLQGSGNLSTHHPKTDKVAGMIHRGRKRSVIQQPT